MDYMTSAEAAVKWGIGLRRVQYFCSEKKIPGAVRMGRQWMIPITAAKPLDGRTKTAKIAFDYDNYHFPGFIWSHYYVTRTDLSEEELSLLEAQTLVLKQEFIESMKICRRLIDSSKSVSVKFGAICTKAYNCILLGLHTDLIDSIAAMEEIRDSSVIHSEDYSLLIGFIKINFNFDSSVIQNIDSKKLSSEAILAYETALLLVPCFDNLRESKHALKTYSVFVDYVERLGIFPAALSVHGILAHLFAISDNKQASEYHIRQACRIGHKENFISILSKYSSLHHSEYIRVLSEYGPDFPLKIDRIHKLNVSNWKATYLVLSENKNSLDCTQIEFEIMLLISNGLSSKAICTVKNISNKILSGYISGICDKLGLNNKAELVEYSRALYKPFK